MNVNDYTNGFSRGTADKNENTIVPNWKLAGYSDGYRAGYENAISN